MKAYLSKRVFYIDSVIPYHQVETFIEQLFEEWGNNLLEDLVDEDDNTDYESSMHHYWEEAEEINEDLEVRYDDSDLFEFFFG